MTKHINLTLLLLCAVLLAHAQKSITVDAAKAEQTFKNLKSGEYNVIVKGNLKAVKVIDTLFWRLIDCKNVTINTLDLSKCYGKDSIVETMRYCYCPKNLILPNDCKYVYGDIAENISVTPKNKYFSVKGWFLVSKDGKHIKNFAVHKYSRKYVIPDGIETIPPNFFGQSADTVFVPKSVRDLGHNYGPNWQISPDNPYYTVENGVLYNKDKTEILYACNVENGFEIPNTVKKIGVGAFADNENLSEIIIPNSVEIIDSAAFAGCCLSEIVIPNSVKRIECRAFANLKKEVTKVVLPDNLEFIGRRAFFRLYKRSTLSVDLPKNIKWIGSRFRAAMLSDRFINFNENEPLDKWYFTLDVNDWLNRKNGIPLSDVSYNDTVAVIRNIPTTLNDFLNGFVIRKDMNCIFGKNKDGYDDYKNVISCDKHVFMNEKTLEEKIFSHKWNEYLLDSYVIDIESIIIYCVHPYFYKLD